MTVMHPRKKRFLHYLIGCNHAKEEIRLGFFVCPAYLNYCKLHGIRLSGPALGRPRKDEQRDRRQTYLDQNERIEVERQFSLAKRKCNLGKVKTKLEETVGFTLAMSIVVLNLRRIQRTLARQLLWFLRHLWPQKNLAFVQ